MIGPDPFFSTGLAAQTAQKQKSRTTKSPLMQDWDRILFLLFFVTINFTVDHVYLDAEKSFLK